MNPTHNTDTAGLTLTALGVMTGGLISMILIAVWMVLGLLFDLPPFSGTYGYIGAAIITLPVAFAGLGFALDTAVDITYVHFRDDP